MGNEHKPLTDAEIVELRKLTNSRRVDYVDMCRVMDALPRLLAMLTPPSDAAVREAMECGPTIDKVLFHVGDDGEGTLGGDAHLLIRHLRTLMSCVRAAQAELNAYRKAVAIKEKAASGFHEGVPAKAAQAPRLTDAQVAALHIAQLRCLEEGNLADVVEILESTFPSAFPELGEG